jgi:hypothetical protein
VACWVLNKLVLFLRITDSEILTYSENGVLGYLSLAFMPFILSAIGLGIYGHVNRIKTLPSLLFFGFLFLSFSIALAVGQFAGCSLFLDVSIFCIAAVVVVFLFCPKLTRPHDGGCVTRKPSAKIALLVMLVVTVFPVAPPLIIVYYFA